MQGKVKSIDGATVKASLNRANKSCGLDPKPGDLTMARLKLQ